MFGRRKEPEPAATSDADRRVLFEALARRPDTVCPFLGLDGARAEYHPGVTREHRCHAFGDPMELSSDQQERVCLQRGYGNCPRYLRGVLVIPTEELEALRRPLPPSKPEPPAAPAPASGDRGRRGLIILGLLVLLAGGAGAGYVAFRGLAAGPTPTPIPSPSPTESLAPTETPEPTVAPTPPLTPVPDPTPRPDDVFIGYEITVLLGDYTIYLVDADGKITDQAAATFSDFSR
ncbi:MAG TPA: hypothetical protein VJA85_02730, partial [Candidatus Limnocylindria bacterium]|nr:hypothetical protein [Candidatus Limnocylindria bacterium]